MKAHAWMITLLAAAEFLPVPALAQEEGPMSLPPPPPTVQRQGEPRPFSVGPKAPAVITNEPPSIPVEQVIQKFGERELEFKREREKFTYDQTFVIETIDRDGEVDGEYKLSSAFVFDKDGKRIETILDAPMPTLKRIMMSQQDLDDLEHIQPFVLTSEELPKYDVTYVGRQQLDEIATYVFDVAPKKIEKKQRYFQGRIWVDQRDMEIVKTYGKAVPDIRTKNGENVFPRFETFRENIEGNYWFPTYTRSNDVLHFTGQDVRIHMTVRYENYKRFGVTIKFGQATEIKSEKPNPDKPNPDKPTKP
jgi:hypothetical protein